jgi:hypothetical protein
VGAAAVRHDDLGPGTGTVAGLPDTVQEALPDTTGNVPTYVAGRWAGHRAETVSVQMPVVASDVATGAAA